MHGRRHWLLLAEVGREVVGIGVVQGRRRRRVLLHEAVDDVSLARVLHGKKSEESIEGKLLLLIA